MQYAKPKDVAKELVPKSERLSAKILDTMKTVSDIVGQTLGPGGQPVLIERQESDLPSIITKDGVTVFRSLSFEDPVAHEIMATARDASVRTVTEAGDGTTTTAVLSEAIVRNVHDYCKNNPKVSPQKVVSRLQSIFRDFIEPAIKAHSQKASMATDEGRKFLHSVAAVSANGDKELADAVIECFNIVGDDGNVTIIEQSGPSKYEIEHLKGFPISMGFETSCSRFYPFFINDKQTQKCVLEKPVFILYDGKISEIQTISQALGKIGRAWLDPAFMGLEKPYNHNVVLVAKGFSESVLGELAINFPVEGSINVYPLVIPKTPEKNGEREFLEDLASLTLSEIFDPISKPLDTADFPDFGRGVEVFESGRYRSSLIGHESELELDDRVQKLQHRLEVEELSILQKSYLQERIAKLTGGIAKLFIIGSSNGELKERRDRADDAVSAVRGAIKHGFLPGGGWMLLKLIHDLGERYPLDPIVEHVLAPALIVPIEKLYKNCGFTPEETVEKVSVITTAIDEDKIVVYDILQDQFLHGVSTLLDSTPAVLEAVKNALSIASLLGTLGAIVVFKRDREVEKREASDIADWNRNANFNPDERW